MAEPVCGPWLRLLAPISFWGGVDPTTGRVVEEAHPSYGASLAGTILYLPGARGSSSGSSVLGELLRIGLGPRALVLAEPDGVLAVGAFVAEELYGVRCPVLVTRDVPDVPDGAIVRVADGRVTTV